MFKRPLWKMQRSKIDFDQRQLRAYSVEKLAIWDFENFRKNIPLLKVREDCREWFKEAATGREAPFSRTPR